MITAHLIHKPLAWTSGAKDFISKSLGLMESKMRVRNIVEVHLYAKSSRSRMLTIADIYRQILGHLAYQRF